VQSWLQSEMFLSNSVDMMKNLLLCISIRDENFMVSLSIFKSFCVYDEANLKVLSKEHKSRGAVCSKGCIVASFLSFVAFINFLPQSYFMLQFYRGKSFKMRHLTSLYFHFSVRYSLKCFRRLLSHYYPD
jgi:hypothetical protein